MPRSFSGTSQHLTATGDAGIQLLGNMSAMFTVTTDTVAAGFAAIMCCQDASGADTEANNSAWYFGRTGSQWVAFHENGSGVNNIITLSTPTISVATEYKVCVRRDVASNTYQWTINGTTYTAVSTGYTNDPTGGGNGDIFIGAGSAANFQSWDGLISEVAVYDVLLSAANAESYTNGTLPSAISAVDLVAYWPLDNAGSTEADEAGTYDLTVVGATQTGAAPSIAMLWCGGVTDTTIDVVVALDAAETSVKLVVDNNSDFSSPTYTSAATATTDITGAGHVIKFQATGLTADTAYHYRITVDDVAVGDPGQFSTTPVAGTAKSFSFALSSCSHGTLWTPNSTVFSQVASSGADLFIHLGDLHYFDNTSADPQSEYHAGIASHFAFSNAAAMYRALPMAYVWDDHDFGPDDNDMVLTSGFATIADRSVQAYGDLVPHYPFAQPVPSGGSPPHVRGITQAFDYGRVRFIMPDLRSFATEGNGTVLGDGGTYGGLITWDQESWMQAELADAMTSGAALVVLLSSRTWKGTADNEGWQINWATYQQELCEYLCDNGIPAVVICGDGHMVGFDDGVDVDYTNGKGQLPSMMASPLNTVASLTTGPYEWQGVVTESPASAVEAHQFVLFTVTDTGTALSWSAEAFNQAGTSVAGPVSSADDTPELNFSAATATVNETAGTVDLVVSKDWFAACSATYSTSDGTATAGTDYTAQTNQPVNFTGINKTTTISIPITSRSGVQGDRTFTVTLDAASGVNATIGATNAVTVTIEDGDPADIAHAHSLDTAVATTAAVATPLSIVNAHALEAPSASASGSVAPLDITHSELLDTVIATFSGTVAPLDVTHAHALETVTAATGDSITALAVSHAHTIGAPTLTFAGVVTPQALSHTNLLDTPVASLALTASAQNVTHSSTLALAVGSATNNAAPLSIDHLDLIDAATALFGGAVAPQDILHGHILDSAGAFNPAVIVLPSKGRLVLVSAGTRIVRVSSSH